MPSIVIPAHNEERQITRCLQALLTDATAGEFDVVVVCNGCDDDTADVARRFGHGVRVIELIEASKTIALNVGDGHATGFPRLYVDADAEIRTAGARELVRVLENGALVAYPRASADLTGASRGVSLYYRAWEQLCYARGDLVGAGAYALSERGRGRFGAFPDVIADDFFVRRLFRRDETAVAQAAESVIHLPRTVAALVRVLTRVIGGNRECEQRYGSLFASGDARPSFVAVIAPRPALWLPALAYAAIVGSAKLHAAWRVRAGAAPAWSHDETARGSGS